MVTSPINPIQYWKLEEIQRMFNKIKGYENVVFEFKYTPSEGKGWHSDHWDCTCGIKERLVNGEWNWLLKYEFQVNDKLESEARLTAFQEMADRLVTDVWRTSINSLRKEQQQLSKIKHSYSDPLPTETLNEILTKAERAADNLEQQINKTNMTNETTNVTDNGTKMTINTQTNNTNTPNTTDGTDNIPTWKKLYKSFVAMLIVFMFVYAGFNVLTWLYDTLGMQHVMPTLIGLALWVAVYDHMYGTASKAPRIK